MPKSKDESSTTEDKTVTEAGVATPAVITEDALIKSLTDLEAKKEEDVKPKETLVKTVDEPTATAEVVAAGATETLTKALEVSKELNEFATLIGGHVDHSLADMAKSINSAAQRDLKIVSVLTRLSKSLDDNTEAISQLMNKPGAAASSLPATVKGTAVLEKGVGATTTALAQETPLQLKARVLSGLDSLMKSATAADDQPELNRLGSVVVKFESTGQINDVDLTKALA